MTASPETVAYLKQVKDYDLAAARDGTEPSNPPKPATAEVAMDASAARAKIIGLILDYQTTGRFPGWEPTPDAQLAAAELIEQYTNQQER
jgi:hypothetical protein